MSSNPKSTTASTGISKSSAKKKAKKSSKVAVDVPDLTPAVAGEVTLEGFDETDLPTDLDPEIFNLPPDFVVGGEFDEYSQLPQLTANGTAPFQLPFPFDYSGVAGGGGGQLNGGGVGGVVPGGFTITNDDLVQTANELYRRMADPNFGNEDPYWSSLPPHLRQFVREAIPFSGNMAGVQKHGQTVTEGQQGMWTMAQQIVSAASQGMGLGPNAPANFFANGMNGNRQYGQGNLAEELGFHRHPDAKDEDFEDDDEFEVDDRGYPVGANGDVPKSKKKNKKKKKSGVNEPPPAPLPPPALKQPPRQPVPPQPTPQPALNPPPPPVTTAPTNPPPSSRAAGKQPMATTTPASNNTAPARSARAAGKAPASAPAAHNHNHTHHNHPPAKPAAKGKAPANGMPTKVWAQTSLEDRGNISNFWLGLNEPERRDLVQIEKDTVLRKIKDQHRHTCACTVCMRKRSDIEHEVEQLYEQFHMDLRSFAQKQRAALAGKHPPPLGAGPFPGSVEVDAAGQVVKLDHLAPDPKLPLREELLGDVGSDEYDEDDYDDEDDVDDDDIGSDEADMGDDLDDPIPPERPPRKAVAVRKKDNPVKAEASTSTEFSAFGSSLTTIKGVLTVADELLKNDGAKFLEMMELLAVSHTSQDLGARDLPSDGEDDAEVKDPPMSEEERIAEGKRMFQIFASRMFEHRVLQAHREKVAKTREEQLLRELEEEDDAKKAREEKKAKESQKKKDKRKQQKQKLDEEKAAKDAAIAAEQEAVKQKAAEAERERLRKIEEERNRREAARRANQEEQARATAERRKRQQEEKEQQEEAAKKKKDREDKARKEREAREKEVKDAKERERREKEEKLAKENSDMERAARERADKERAVKEAKQAKEQAERDRQARLKAEEVKTRQEEMAKKEREVAEQAKVLAAQQAARDRAKAEQKAQADRAAALERAAAAASTIGSRASPVAPIPVRAQMSTHDGPSGSLSPSETPSPVKGMAPIAGGSMPLQRPPRQKSPSPYYAQAQPGPSPATSSYSTSRMPIPMSYSANLRPGQSYPGASPSMTPPAGTTSLNGPSSPNPPTATRGFAPEPSPPFDLGPRTAPIGVGFPQARKSSSRIPSIDESFGLTSASHISQPSSRNVSGEEIPSLHALRPPSTSSNPAPIGPPGPIGRPGSFMDPPATVTTSHQSISPTSSRPEKILGSAALGGDDEIVPPTRRNLSNGWGNDMPLGAAPGSASRWSAAPGTGASIWSSTPASSSNDLPSSSSPWGSMLGSASSARPQTQSSFSGQLANPFANGVGPGGVGGVGGIGQNHSALPHSHSSHTVHAGSHALGLNHVGQGGQPGLSGGMGHHPMSPHGLSSGQGPFGSAGGLPQHSGGHGGPGSMFSPPPGLSGLAGTGMGMGGGSNQQHPSQQHLQQHQQSRSYLHQQH